MTSMRAANSLADSRLDNTFGANGSAGLAQQNAMREYSSSLSSDPFATHPNSSPSGPHQSPVSAPAEHAPTPSLVESNQVNGSKKRPTEESQPATSNLSAGNVNLILSPATERGTELFSSTWFRPIEQQSHQPQETHKECDALDNGRRYDLSLGDEGKLTPVKQLQQQPQPSPRPYVDDNHRLRYQDIEDEMRSNESGENDEGKWPLPAVLPGSYVSPLSLSGPTKRQQKTGNIFSYRCKFRHGTLQCDAAETARSMALGVCKERRCHGSRHDLPLGLLEQLLTG